ncbi:hypothetical protein MHZ92_14590 [Sporosarcina sp. ACRSL]|uniref:hypothetical protein n=1 Tax=Sporosarcina sp. ACRSL TaxID=2918215 RepID=UPI001EF62EFB|nr:hypothetical protein [Sporosarcina sp. ACRSL]MCG7345364.1 hypothetical protein [Sporosarcina sp. ACRSL]
MTERLTTEQLEAIRKRAEAATVGEWEYFNPRLYSHSIVKSGDIDGRSIAKEISREADGEFIAHAREDIPALLAEVERLQAAYEDMTSIALWSTRRLRFEEHKDFAYDAIERNLGRKVGRI